MGILLGCIADDLTGASDVALMLAKHGMNVSLCLSIPGDLETQNCDAVVVALKTRTCAVVQAIKSTLEAARWLQAQGAEQFYFKYCSTFDSTEEGNIGPVSMALAKHLNQSTTVYVPSFPANKRSVYKGHLFVGEHLISDSPMKDHPLTPMTEANLVNFLARQVPETEQVGLVNLDVVQTGVGALIENISEQSAAGVNHLIVDCVNDSDLHIIGEACASHQLISGGSALAMGLPKNFQRQGLLNAGHGTVALPQLDGPVAIIAGSCSAATRQQIRHLGPSIPAIDIDAEKLLEDENHLSELLSVCFEKLTGAALLVYSSASPERVRAIQEKYGVEKSSLVVESALQAVAIALREAGVRKFVVAGGETSGAVGFALGIQQLHIGPEIAPGVPWTLSSPERDPLLLAFKSGNFGAENFFTHAISLLP